MEYTRKYAFQTKEGRKAYWAWQDMIRRCHSETHPDYENYGARGIWVSDKFRKSFDAFIKEIGIPNLHDYLDRIDNRKGYVSGNIRWTDASTSVRNREPFGLSKYRGVSFNKESGKWYSFVFVNGASKFVGGFLDEVDAARAYDSALIYWKNIDNRITLRSLNFPEKTPLPFNVGVQADRTYAKIKRFEKKLGRKFLDRRGK